MAPPVKDALLDAQHEGNCRVIATFFYNDARLNGLDNATKRWSLWETSSETKTAVKQTEHVKKCHDCGAVVESVASRCVSCAEKQRIYWQNRKKREHTH